MCDLLVIWVGRRISDRDGDVSKNTNKITTKQIQDLIVNHDKLLEYSF